MESGSKDSPPSPQTKVVVSISEEKRGWVELALRIRGLKPKSQPNKFFIRMGKPPDPGALMSNGDVKEWRLTSSGLYLRLAVQIAKETKKDREHNAKVLAQNAENDGITTTKTEIFEYKIEQFPCEIDTESVKYDVCQPSGRNYSFIMVKMEKRQPHISWTAYQRENGILDAAADD